MRPERALRFLDSLDGLAYAARLACAGTLGRRLRAGLLLGGFLLGMVAGGVPLL
jgi:hypothetical protein